MRTLVLMPVLLLMVGCSTAAPMMRNVPVEYRFDNVRDAPSASEWEKIKSVLERYVKTVNGEILRERTVGETSIRSYKAKVILADLAAMESIHADLSRYGPRHGPGIGWTSGSTG